MHNHFVLIRNDLVIFYEPITNVCQTGNQHNVRSFVFEYKWPNTLTLH